MSDKRLAITHASSLLAESLIQLLVESGVAPDSVVLLDTTEQADARLAFGDTYLTVVDQSEFDFEDLAAVVLLQADDELQGLLEHADCYVITHVGDVQQALYFDAGEQSSVMPDAPCWVHLAGSELSTLVSVLRPLTELATIEALNVVSVQSVSVFGQSAIDELAGQTIALLNSRDPEPAVFPLQVAFNMLPQTVAAELPAQAAALLGQSSMRVSVQTLVAAAFHGLAIAVSLEFSDDLALDDIRQALQSQGDVVITQEAVSAHTHCKEGYKMHVFGMGQSQSQTNRLQFWIIADSIRNGLVKNYLNAIQVLPNIVL